MALASYVFLANLPLAARIVWVRGFRMVGALCWGMFGFSKAGLLVVGKVAWYSDIRVMTAFLWEPASWSKPSSSSSFSSSSYPGLTRSATLFMFIIR